MIRNKEDIEMWARILAPVLPNGTSGPSSEYTKITRAFNKELRKRKLKNIYENTKETIRHKT